MRGSRLSEVRCRRGRQERTGGKRRDNRIPGEEDSSVPQAKMGWKVCSRAGAGGVPEVWGVWREAHRAGVPGQVGGGSQMEVNEAAHQQDQQHKGRHKAPQPTIDGEDRAANYDNQVCKEPGQKGRKASERPVGLCQALGAGSV